MYLLLKFPLLASLGDEGSWRDKSWFVSEQSEFKSTPRKLTEEPLRTRYWGAFFLDTLFWAFKKKYPGFGAEPHYN